jgi:putative hydrolase of the HAD superfamily
MTDLPMTQTPHPAPAFSHIDVWIFDLDNTLYPASSNLFAQIDQRMTEYIGEAFDLPWDEARRRQKQYFRDYGTTLRGLMVEHDIDPIAFMDYVHDIDVTPVAPSADLDAALGRLPGRKVIYTNGSSRHADNVLGRLGIARHFDLIYDIVAAEYVPKPDPRPYAELVEKYRIDPRRACMVEDIARNLVPAAALGMTTVWVRSEADYARPDRGGVGHGDHIHHAIDDLVEWLGDLTRDMGGTQKAV